MQFAIDLNYLPQTEGEAVRVTEGEHDIAIFRIGESWRAIGNECPHQGASLCDGWIDDGVVACPLHAWQFSTKTGECLSVPNLSVPVYQIVIQDEQALIQQIETPESSSEQ